MNLSAMSLKDITTYHLIIELIYKGKAEIIPEVESLEPFEINEIKAILQSRAQKDFGDNINQWVDWFIESKDESTDAERETIRLLKKFKDQNDFYIEKLSPPSESG